MYPELFRIGNFPINTYGVLLAIAFLAGLLITAKLAARDGLPRERIYDLGLWILLAAIVGSKVLMLVTEPEYRENPLRLFSLDFLRSGGVFYGGFLGAVIVGYFLIRRYKLPWWKTADAFAPGIALGNALGRQGCFAAGCCWGKPTTLPWGVQFTEAGSKVTGVPVVDASGAPLHLHPTQLYESFGALLIFFFLLWLYRRKRFSGQVILFYAVLYAVLRFTVEIFRDDPRGDILGLTTLTGLSTSQMLSIIVGIGSLVLLIIRWRRANAGTEKVSSTPNTARA
ncbi:MAG: phosphatidylglycerol---prolipoprotein diacylglyceryl transferase [Acidobacteriota bacterium]|jgi:phosphatidylglycerol:prolipoprotein diacylglycerol transferase|nr:phosphatidylglycerol---prolipoprotein diacylglyceryl transferase [Acidobacteriota bacterium]